MADEKVYKPEVISDQPFPASEESSNYVSQAAAGGVYSPNEIKDNPLPRRKIAHELLASALNTKSRKILAEFEFTQMGAIQIGNYQAGVSGDIRISPDGIVGRNAAGLTTFALDGDTGNAVFRGIVQAGSFISGSIITGVVWVGDNTIKIDGENGQIIVNDGTNDRVLIGRF